MENQNEFREILRKHRKNLGISQGELAAMADISQSTLANFEIGQFNLSAASLENVRQALLKLIEERATAGASFRRRLLSFPLGREMRAAV
jgi:predicted transcriptional regulator